MKQYNSLIIDDEPLARRIIVNYLSNFPQLNLVRECSNAFDAITALKAQPIDILFLDINMPKLSGINFLKTIKNPPLVIFTTAYPEYAVEGFELEAIDFLVKPFSLERFTKAVLKATQQLEIQTQLAQSQTQQASNLIIKADKKIHKIHQADILYLEAYGDYVKIFTTTNKYLPKAKLFEIQQELNSQFLQIHRSYIVNLAHIAYIEGNRVKVGEEMLPVSLTFRKELLEGFR